MDATKIGVEELLPQKRYHKNNLDCTDTSEQTYCSGTAKKIMGNIDHRIKYLINTQLLIAKW